MRRGKETLSFEEAIEKEAERLRGGYVLPRYLQYVYPGSLIGVVEIDPAVTRWRMNVLGLASRAAAHPARGRPFFLRRPQRSYDLVFADVFESIPFHVEIREVPR